MMHKIRIIFQLFNAAGQEIMSEEHLLGVGNNSLEIDLSSQPEGVYFLSIFDGFDKIAQKLIKLP